jgi:hypothetical protein
MEQCQVFRKCRPARTAIPEVPEANSDLVSSSVVAPSPEAVAATSAE